LLHVSLLHVLAASSSGGSSLTGFLPLVLIVVAFFFLLIRPQRARAKQMQQVRAALIPGSQVITTSGMFATVTAVDDEAVTLELAPGVHGRFLRAAIGKVVSSAAVGSSGGGDGSVSDTSIELPPDDRPPA
jgi:preprotein translocase subunit YajC